MSLLYNSPSTINFILCQQDTRISVQLENMFLVILHLIPSLPVLFDDRRNTVWKLSSVGQLSCALIRSSGLPIFERQFIAKNFTSSTSWIYLVIKWRRTFQIDPFLQHRPPTCLTRSLVECSFLNHPRTLKETTNCCDEETSIHILKLFPTLLAAKCSKFGLVTILPMDDHKGCVPMGGLSLQWSPTFLGVLMVVAVSKALGNLHQKVKPSQEHSSQVVYTHIVSKTYAAVKCNAEALCSVNTA